MKQNSLARVLQPRLPRLVLILCLIQPVMDVLSYWMDKAGMDNTVTLLLRLCVLALIVLTGACLSRRRWIYMAAAGVLVLLTGTHVAVCLYYGYQDPIADLTNLVRIYQLPLTTLAFITYFRCDQRSLDAAKLGFLGCLAIIVAVELLATVTATDPHTYANKGVGVLGWFMTPNVQSSILSMIVPVAIVCVLERKKLHPLWTAGAGLVGFGVLYLFATRLSYAALLGCAFGLAVSCVIIKLVRKEQAGRAAAIFAVLGLAAILLAGVSPMEANNRMVAENAERKQADILTLVEQDTEAAQAMGLTGQELQTAALKSAYEKYIPGVVGRFGLERTAEYYSYTTHVSDLSNTRLQRQSYNLMLMEDQPLARWFGLELGDLTYDGATYDAENDFHGIYFLCGLAGLVLMIVFVACFLVRIVIALVKDFKGRFTLSAAGFGIALICGLAHAYFTAGVLRRPNSNFYLAVILAAVYALTMGRPDTRDIEEKRL